MRAPKAMPRSARLLVVAVAITSARVAHAAPEGESPPVVPSAAPKEVAPPPPVDREAAKATARARFEAGIAHLDAGEWSAALADFLASRALFPTRSATKNAAVCFRHEGRYDEALDTFEALVKDFPDLSREDRAFADAQITDLRGSVGTLEITNAEVGAAVVVDARMRATYPEGGPLRVSAGTHVVRVQKEGFLPFERRVDVGSRQAVVLDARLSPLERAGRLSVAAVGAPVEVVVDNVVVGKAPWQGSVAVGAHTVLLRGEGDIGSPPTSVAVKLGETSALTLAAEPLRATLRIAPTPASSLVSVDGVVVGHGVWEGRVRAGRHVVESAEPGFVAQRLTLDLAEGKSESLAPSLERDPTSPLWKVARPSQFFAGVDLGPALGLSFGGDIRGRCDGACSANVPLGASIAAHFGYATSRGLVVGLAVGGMSLAADVSNRSTATMPKGLPPNAGTTSHSLGLRGFRVGPEVALRLGDPTSVTFGLGLGVLVGSVVDAREGTFVTSRGVPYAVSVSEVHAATFAYVAPELRLARRFGPRVDVGVSLAAMAFFSLGVPRWRDERQVLAGPAGTQGDGLATFGSERLAGSTVLVLVPTANARFSF